MDEREECDSRERERDEMREKREMRGGDMKRGFSNGKQILAVQFKYLF